MNALTLALSILSSAVARPTDSLKLSEIHYHPGCHPGGGSAATSHERAEWLEIRNLSSRARSLSGVRLARAVRFEFPRNASLGAQECGVVVRDPLVFGAAHPNFVGQVFGPYRGTLRNSGERVELVNRDERVLDSARYSDDRPWPLLADGGGHSLERVDFDAPPESPSAWRASATVGGSPGTYAERFASGFTWIDRAGIVRCGRREPIPPHAPVSIAPVSLAADVEWTTCAGDVELLWQALPPGKWRARTADGFDDSWQGQTMLRSVGDRYFASIGGIPNRTVVRWKIRAACSKCPIAHTGEYPSSSDPSPNLAFASAEARESRESRDSRGIPVITLFAASRSIESAFRTRVGVGRDDRWRGTLDVRGHTFDHVSFRLLGKSTRFYGEKRSLRFRLARGDAMRLWDDASASSHRSIELLAARDSYGLGEVLAAEIFRAAGLPVPRMRFVELRVVSTVNATNDSFGLYLLREPFGEAFLDSAELAGAAAFELKGTPVERIASSDDRRALAALRDSLASGDPSRFVDVDRYVSFRAAIALAEIRDLGSWNHFLIREPNGGAGDPSRRWFLIPADLNCAFGSHTSTDQDFFSTKLLPLVRERIAQRIRELRQSDELEAAFHRVRDIAKSIESVVVADRARWTRERYRSRAPTALATVERLIAEPGQRPLGQEVDH